MAQITEIIMTAYERLQKLIQEGNIYTKSQLDAKLDEIRATLGTYVADRITEMLGDGTLTNLTIADNSLDTIKIKNGSVTSIKVYRGYGSIIQSNAITIDLTSKKVTVNKNTQVYIDKTVATVATAGTELTYTALYDIALYVDLTDNILKVGDIKSIPNAHLILASVNISGSACNLLGNSRSISVYKDGYKLFDAIADTVLGAVGNKINIKITDLTLTIELTESSTATRVFANGVMYTVASTEGITVTELNSSLNLLFDTNTSKMFVKPAGNANRYATNNNNIVLLCSFVPTTKVIKNMSIGSLHNILINQTDYFGYSAQLTNSIDPNFPYSTYGMDVERAMAKKPNVFNTSLVAEGGMLTTIAGKNANWNQKYNGTTWLPGYDGGNGGHALQCYAKNKQYRLTGILDIRRTDNSLPMASFFNWMPPLGKFGWLRLGCDDYGQYTNGSSGTRHGGIEVTDRMSRINTVNIMQSNPYEQYLPQDYEIDESGAFVKDENGNVIPKARVAMTNYNVFQANTINELVYKKKGSDNYKQVAFIDDLEKELMALTAINNATLNIENNTIVLPNHRRNRVTIDNGLIKNVKSISSYTLVGTENWSLKTAGDTANIFACSELTMDTYSFDYANSNVNMLCDNAVCRYATSATLLDGESVVLMGRSGIKGFLILISTSLATDVASLKTYLASNNLKVYYELATEVTTEII